MRMLHMFPGQWFIPEGLFSLHGSAVAHVERGGDPSPLALHARLRRSGHSSPSQKSTLRTRPLTCHSRSSSDQSHRDYVVSFAY